MRTAAAALVVVVMGLVSGEGGTRQQMFSDLFDTVGNSHRGITNKCGYPCFKERILNGLNFLLDQIIISILSTR